MKDHKITEVLDVSDIPKQITRLELPGTTLMPGMINAHEHPLLYKNDYQNGHLQASSAYKALIGLSTLQGLLEAGWTTLRVMGDGDIFYANQDIRLLRVLLLRVLLLKVLSLRVLLLRVSLLKVLLLRVLLLSLKLMAEPCPSE